MSAGELNAGLLYLKLMLRLRAMIDAGTDETDAGDALRDEMDAPWSAMTEQEQAAYREISDYLWPSAT